jgi:oligopeptide transport system ATP-binding protein
MAGKELLRVTGLSKTFRIRQSGKKIEVKALDDVSLTLCESETLAIVGESGSGKSTLGRTLMALERPDSGTVLFDGQSPFDLKGDRLRLWRRDIQMVFQDPYASLNARMTARQLVSEPWQTHRDLYPTASERDARADQLLEMVGLRAQHAHKSPRAFSGGQLQRIGIARALALDPRIIVCDEPVSGLDLSVQGQVLNVLKDLQRRLGVAYVFISHDMSVVRHMADRVAVMHHGRIVESGPVATVLDSPTHAYTRALIDAAPSLSNL